MKEYVTVHALALAVGTLADFIIPDPHMPFHPIRLLGTLISTLEKALYKKSDSNCQMVRGMALFCIVITVTAAVSAAVTIGSCCVDPYFGAALEAIAVYFILASGSLRYESMKVYRALDGNDPSSLSTARYCLSMIVGRDTESLDQAGIIRATVETVAENTSDGVIAPMLYTAVFGPVGGFVYKAVNTMDSMLGYHNDRYEYFGKVSAVADDILNFIPSRISALSMTGSAFILGLFSKDFDGKRGSYIWRRDRGKHDSPNSAQTESVCAGALGIRLGGKATYGGKAACRPYIGDDTRPVERDDIKKAIVLMYGAAVITALFIQAVLWIV